MKDYLTKTRDITSGEREKVWAARIGMTAEDHLREAAALLAGDIERQPWDGGYYCRASATTEQATRAMAHAALAQAMAAVEARRATVEAPEIRPAVPR